MVIGIKFGDRLHTFRYKELVNWFIEDIGDYDANSTVRRKFWSLVRKTEKKIEIEMERESAKGF